MVPHISSAVSVPWTTPGIAMDVTAGGLSELEVSISPAMAFPGAIVMYSMVTYLSWSAR